MVRRWESRVPFAKMPVCYHSQDGDPPYQLKDRQHPVIHVQWPPPGSAGQIQRVLGKTVVGGGSTDDPGTRPDLEDSVFDP